MKSSSVQPILADKLTLFVFILLVILGGSNAVAVRFSNLELPPFWGAAFRFSAAALIFWIIVLLRRIPLPKGKALLGVSIYGALGFGVSYALLYWALLSVTASLTMVILALGPLLTFFLAWTHGLEAFRWRGLFGALVAFAGILLAVGDQIGSSLPLLPLLAILGAAVAIAESSVLYKSYPKGDPLAVNAVALSVAALILLSLSLLVGEAWNLPGSATTWIAFAYLVLVGSVLVFYLFLYVLDRWTASATSYSFLLFPVATILIASWLTDEVITLRFLLGGAIVLLGVWVGALAQSRKTKP
jgi:drug/metabolite transporter (DMT)-like permease